MGVETPWALLLLGLSMFPMLLHRIRRRHLETRPWPTLRFIRQAVEARRRKQKLSDLLLLALRMALLAAAALALAKPFVEVALPYGDGQVTALAIVVDDSMSMTRASSGGSLLEEAIGRGIDAIADLPEGSEVTVIGAGAPARALATRSADLAGVRLALERMDTRSYRGTDLAAALALANEQLVGSDVPAKRTLVLSDFATHANTSGALQAAPDVPVQLEPLGAGLPANNAFVRSASARPDPQDPKHTLVEVEVGASGIGDQPIQVSVERGGQALVTESLDPDQRGAPLTLRIPTPPAEGDPRAEVRIEVADALAADNTSGLLLHASHVVRVLLVNGDPHPASDQDELYYLKRALDHSPVPFAVEVVDTAGFEQSDLAHYDVCVLANVAPPAPATAERIARFVEQGGGLVIAPGSNTPARAFEAAMGETLPVRMRAAANARAAKLAEPPDSRLLPHGLAGLREVQTVRRWVLETHKAPALAFADGLAALVVEAVGEGRVAVLATTLDDGWTDLPLRPGFIALAGRIIEEVSGAASHEGQLRGPGHPVRIGVPAGAARLEIIGPDVVRHRLEAPEGQTTVRFTETQLAGGYRVLAAGPTGVYREVPGAAFVLRAPAEESDLSAATDARDVLKRTGANLTSGGLAKRPLAPWLYALALLLALAEAIVRTRTPKAAAP